MLCSANRSSVPLETQERASRKVTKSPDLGCYKLSNMSETDFWRECPQIFSDPEVVHGAPVFKGTRLPARKSQRRLQCGGLVRPTDQSPPAPTRALSRFRGYR